MQNLCIYHEKLESMCMPCLGLPLKQSSSNYVVAEAGGEGFKVFHNRLLFLLKISDHTVQRSSLPLRGRQSYPGQSSTQITSKRGQNSCIQDPRNA